ncbi:hypothetical protein FSHL1_012477 [Fusarium sambucinum]
MHWISIVTVLGAALAPTASARPACRPDPTTSSGITTTAIDVKTLSTATIEPSSTLTAIATDETTTALQNTVTSSGTATLDSTILISTTVAETTAAAETTTAEVETTSATGVATTTEGETTTVQGTTITEVQTTSAAEAVTTTEAETTTAEATTTTAAAGPTSLTKNSGFESRGNTAWALQGTEIKNTGLAHSGTHFLKFGVDNGYATGQFRAGQAVIGLDTNKQYQFTFYATVFSSPAPVRSNGALCTIQAVEDDAIMAVFFLDFNNLDSYQPLTSPFYPVHSDFTFNLRLECSNGEKVTLALGVDDITITEASS